MSLRILATIRLVVAAASGASPGLRSRRRIVAPNDDGEDLHRRGRPRRGRRVLLPGAPVHRGRAELADGEADFRWQRALPDPAAGGLDAVPRGDRGAFIRQTLDACSPRF